MNATCSRNSQSLKPPAFVRLGLFTLAAGALTAAGCAALMPGGAHRSPAFQTGNAPEPTVSTTVLSCVSSALRPGAGDNLTAQFNALSRASMAAAPVPLPRSAESVLCNTIAASDAFHAWRETTPAPSAVATIRELAQATGAKAIAIPVMRLYARCEQDTKTVRDASGAPIATIQEGTQTCRMDRTKDVGLFLFAEDGMILYRATRRVGMTSREDPEPDMNEVLANIPATFTATATSARAGAGSAAPAANMAPAGSGFVPAAAPAAPAAPQGAGPTDPKIDSAIHDVNPKAPDDCKKFVKAICRSASIPDTSRLQMCAGYVTTVNQLVQQQKAQSAEACKGLLKSAPAN